MSEQREHNKAPHDATPAAAKKQGEHSKKGIAPESAGFDKKLDGPNRPST